MKYTKGPWAFTQRVPFLAMTGSGKVKCIQYHDKVIASLSGNSEEDIGNHSLLLNVPDLYEDAKLVCDYYIKIYKELPEGYYREQLSVLIGRLAASIEKVKRK